MAVQAFGFFILILRRASAAAGVARAAGRSRSRRCYLVILEHVLVGHDLLKHLNFQHFRGLQSLSAAFGTLDHCFQPIFLRTAPNDLIFLFCFLLARGSNPSTSHLNRNSNKKIIVFIFYPPPFPQLSEPTANTFSNTAT